MKLATVLLDDNAYFGRIEEENIVLLGEGDISRAVTGDIDPAGPGRRVSLGEVELMAPLFAPGKIICVAANYQEHVLESGFDPRKKASSSPRLFLKPNTTISGDNDSVTVPVFTEQLDWEVELAVILRHGGRDIQPDSALQHVFGYTVANDISVRNLNWGYPREQDPASNFFDWLEGKWIDGSAPIGPVVVTADAIQDPQDLNLTLRVNDRIMQDGNTRDMIHTVAELIAFSSQLMTLAPGDIILTGTPSGVGMASGTFLQPGDDMVAAIEEIGELRTRVVASTANALRPTTAQ